MKPLYVTSSNGVQPFHRMATELYHRVKELDAGDCIYFCQPEPEDEKLFEVAMYTKILAKAVEVIDERPVIALDSDHVLLRPIIEVFSAEWDVAAVYRKRCQNDYGRQDYSSGIVMLNNKRPGIIRQFCSEWLRKMRAWPIVPGWCPTALKEAGWADSWWADQSAFNEIVAPTEGDITHGEIHTVNGYRILPLKEGEYGKKGSFIKHFKGKRKWKEKCRT